MDRDSKSTPLKSLQGRIWLQGYRSGKLKAEVFPDVPPALGRWNAQGRNVFIFSSGSVLAQQLLFEHTQFGDLRPFIQGYFDTQVGAKQEPSSYRRIAAEIRMDLQSILFISDVVAELDAARQAGMQTLLCLRQGAVASEPVAHAVIHDFEQVLA